MSYNLTDPYEIARYIKEAKKSTPCKAYIQGNLNECSFANIDHFGENNFFVLFGENDEIEAFINDNKTKIEKYRLEVDRRNSAIPLLDLSKLDARIEPGALIRDKVSIGKKVVVMMGAVINIGAEIGEESMIDMNAVLGARAKVGKRCHVGAGAVIAGVLEPPSKSPCEVEDNVVIGANAVILEGVKIGKNSVVAAGSIVTTDVPENVVVAGAPAKIIKSVDDKTKGKTEILEDLR
ncbi:2,3,4,5-tetrahydropyridine-2,6-dicarboxylate N-acetyltransferase [Hathewaya histolytica]|uniref:2,3,4,5-tetrahydropyridine-2,6-dicarboxylate N-acetyltransferase n=1 Tax=Hathewaya histolytica TaxID=1498 RepID=A0A4U9RNL8_HATHI|nr:2,3,4,5-tetrahydropyridine-2,6-dicarboxylate N-acetyltransferase [Hathewaya histolytica]VTQ93076.1 tetrahydrodipicolinate N-succinyltransferase [Hathewaya histolytica]